MPVVQLAIEDNIAVMTIDRPESRNAMNGAVARELGACYAEIERNPAIRVGILTGAGGTFCSGMDLRGFVAGEKIDASGIPYGGKDNAVVTKPIIAAVEGFAFAGGFELALTCDLIVASRTAKFGLPEVRRGLIAAGGALVRLPRQGPLRLALEMGLTGEAMDAERLYMLGVVNRLTPEGGALAEAKALARTIADNAPLAVAATKKVIRESLSWPDGEAYDRQRPLTSPISQSADAREGAAAFAEKRPARWSGA